MRFFFFFCNLLLLLRLVDSGEVGDIENRCITNLMVRRLGFNFCLVYFWMRCVMGGIRVFKVFEIIIIFFFVFSFLLSGQPPNKTRAALSLFLVLCF